MPINNKLIVYLFSLLPLSIILGNFLINLNILLINSFTLFYCIKNNEWSFIKEKSFKILIILYLYLIFNSFLNFYLNPNYGFDGILRSINFIKFIFLGFTLYIVPIKKIELKKIFIIWIIIILILSVDLIFEFIFKFNLLGFKSLDQTRLASFFYDEYVSGSFLFAFGFVTIIFFFDNKADLLKKSFLNLLFLIIPILILLTGERSNFLKSIILFLLIFYFINKSFLVLNKKIIFVVFISIISILINFNNSILTKQTEFFKRIISIQEPKNIYDAIQNIKYFAHYDAAWNIFKNHPLNGVGSKNFRNECNKKKYFNEKLKFSVQRCTTHPHQVHFELFSEQGIIGYIIFLYFIFYLLKNKLIENFDSNNPFNLTINLYLLVFLVPLLPSGSFFSSFNGSLFWIIFALSNRKIYL
jgi:O-antigen ligase